MSAFIYLPNCEASIDFMTSKFVFSKDGYHDHYLAFLITNKSERTPDEIMMVYPFTFEADKMLYRIDIRNYSPIQQAKRNDIQDIVISDTYEYNANDFFKYNDSRAQAQSFRYRGFWYDSNIYHGWYGSAPRVERVDINTELLKSCPDTGYSIFRIKAGLNLSKDLSQWVFLHFKVDCHPKKKLGRLVEGIKGVLFYSHSLYDPHSVKNKLVRHLHDQIESGSDQLMEMAQDLKTILTEMSLFSSQVNINKYVLHFIFAKNVEKKEIAGQCPLGKPLNVEALSADENIYYRITLNNLNDGSKGNITVKMIEEYHVWDIIKPAGKVIKMFFGHYK